MKSPMLAVSVKDLSLLKYPLLASPKLDGVRCLGMGGQALSRKFKPIPNLYVQSLFKSGKLDGLDGELVVGSPTDPDCYRNTVSSVMSVEGTPSMTFHVFDDFTASDAAFDTRLERAFRRTSRDGVAYVNHVTIRTEEQLLAYEEQCLTRGYEGVMLRHMSGLYKEGRSTLKEGWLMKLKRFEDSEAEVLGFQELQHNGNEKEMGRGGQMERSHKKAGMVGLGKLGAFLVRDVKTGAEFSVGSGFTQADREIFWAVQEDLKGRLVKYQFFPGGSKDRPRFPTFKGFRDPIDL